MSIYILNNKHGSSAWVLIDEKSREFSKVKQRAHKLFILTCYVDLDLIEKYVKYLLKSMRLTEVTLAFNFAEIYKNGPSSTVDKLKLIQVKLKKKGVEFEWKALASSKLVHSKGYALIQKTSDGVSDGIVLITSANFTMPGFNGDNVEIGYLSTRKNDIKEFQTTYEYFLDNLGSDIGPAIFKQEKYLLKYSILSSGLFLHKWSGSISQQIGIRYELTSLAKEKGTIAPELASLGFEAGDTFTRQILKIGELPQKEIPRSFIARFTIETYWGRWCPREAWKVLSESFEGASHFIQEFMILTDDSTLENAKNEALVVQSELIEKGLIKPVKADHLENWVVRIQELRSNHRRLERFFIGYEAHDLPYSIEQKADVQELFNSLEEAIALSKATNIAKEKVLAAINEANPDLICFADEEIQVVHEMSDNI